MMTEQETTPPVTSKKLSTISRKRCMPRLPEKNRSHLRRRIVRALFSSENELVHKFILIIIDKRLSLFPEPLVAREFNYVSGKIDVVAIGKNHRLFSFEAKLTKWRDALHQAYRNSSFCHFSYVLVPPAISARAMKAKDSFLQRRVGLCSLRDGRIEIKIRAPLNSPLQPWLTKSAKEFILKESNAE
jgi:hypothetical protein